MDGIGGIKMGLYDKNDKEEKHNHTWINLNRITAREFSEKYCPYGILAKQINRKLNSGEISYDEIDQMYDHNTFNYWYFKYQKFNKK